MSETLPETGSDGSAIGSFRKPRSARFDVDLAGEIDAAARQHRFINREPGYNV
jgi:hypothetical protein